MEIALVEAVLIDLYIRAYVCLHLQAGVYDKSSTFLYEFRVVTETVKVSLLGTVYVEMVGVGSCNDAHPWSEPMERAVKLIGLYDHIVAAVRQYVVGAVVL